MTVKVEPGWSGPGGSSLSLRCDLDSVGELHSHDEFWQQVVTVEAPPAFLGGLGEFEDHGYRGFVREAALAPHSAVTHRCERALDDVCCAQMLPMFGWEVVEGQQRLAILGMAA